MIVLVGDVRGIGMHTFTVSEVPIRGKTFILATESMPHGCTDLFSNIDDAVLFPIGSSLVILLKRMTKHKSAILCYILQIPSSIQPR